jgi:hypothetical protein
VTAYHFDSRGRKITSQTCRQTMDALFLVRLYANWQYAIVCSRDGTPCEMFVRL